MTTKLITAHYTINGTPATGLSPVIYIISVSQSGNVLEINGDSLSEIGMGWYRYDFAVYDPMLSYVFTIDGGTGLQPHDRYKYGGNESYVEDVSSGVWEEESTNHTNTGTTGLMLNQIKADTTTTVINTGTLQALVNTLLKYERNRTKLNSTNHTLTVYDDDCVTPLTVFKLRDHAGNPSITEICERSPTSCG